jgi:hypothetical protein
MSKDLNRWKNYWCVALLLLQVNCNGLGRIVRVATAFITPLTDEFIPADEAAHIVEVMCRLVISYYLSPSLTFDFANEDATRTFVRTFLLPSTSSVVVTQ